MLFPWYLQICFGKDALSYLICCLWLSRVSRAILTWSVDLVKSAALFLISALLLNGCTDEFSRINEDPNAITNPEPEQLFAFSLFKLGDYQYSEWFYDNYLYIMPAIQQVVPIDGNAADMNRIFDTGGRYWSFYGEIMPNLAEIRHRVDEMNAGEAVLYQKLYHLTHVLQIMHGLKVTDVYGSLIYSESMKGRDFRDFSMPYDTQLKLFEIWHEQLNDAIEVLLTKPDEDAISPGDNDFVYRGDWGLWAKLANSLKLRMAVRLEYAAPEFMQQMIDEALASPAGLISSLEEQFWWEPEPGYRGTAYDIPNEAIAAAPFMEMLKESRDPRTLWFFEPNDFDQKQLEMLRDSLLPVPGIIPHTITSLWDRFIGAPVEPDSSSVGDYFSVYRDSRNVRLYQLSRLNRFLFAPKTNNRNGVYVDVMFSAAEVSLYLAEFVEKGYLNGEARDWYEKGINLSMKTYWKMAQKADIPLLDSVALTSADLESYLGNSFFAWEVGENNLEKIYLQQYINFFKLPNESFTLARRTGIPFKSSTLLRWHPLKAGNDELKFPRRWPILPPSVTTNINYFNQAMNQQGFTVGAFDPQILNRERVWWDVKAPGFGEEMQ